MRMQLIRGHQVEQFDVIRLYVAVDKDTQDEVLKSFYNQEEKQELPEGDA